MRGAALLLLCGAAVGLTGCGGGRAAGGGELRLQREDLLAACGALRQAEAGVSAELAASKRAWRLVANGLPRDGAGLASARPTVEAAARTRSAPRCTPAKSNASRAPTPKSATACIRTSAFGSALEGAIAPFERIGYRPRRA